MRQLWLVCIGNLLSGVDLCEEKYDAFEHFRDGSIKKPVSRNISRVLMPQKSHVYDCSAIAVLTTWIITGVSALLPIPGSTPDYTVTSNLTVIIWTHLVDTGPRRSPFV